MRRLGWGCPENDVLVNLTYNCTEKILGEEQTSCEWLVQTRQWFARKIDLGSISELRVGGKGCLQCCHFFRGVAS